MAEIRVDPLESFPLRNARLRRAADHWLGRDRADRVENRSPLPALGGVVADCDVTEHRPASARLCLADVAAGFQLVPGSGPMECRGRLVVGNVGRPWPRTARHTTHRRMVSTLQPLGDNRPGPVHLGDCLGSSRHRSFFRWTRHLIARTAGRAWLHTGRTDDAVPDTSHRNDPPARRWAGAARAGVGNSRGSQHEWPPDPSVGRTARPDRVPDRNRSRRSRPAAQAGDLHVGLLRPGHIQPGPGATWGGPRIATSQLTGATADGRRTAVLSHHRSCRHRPELESPNPFRWHPIAVRMAAGLVAAPSAIPARHARRPALPPTVTT